jgi:hypothetical protein
METDMKIPKGADLQLKTENDLVELHITAAITTKVQAEELAQAIRQFSAVLEGPRRSRRRAPALAQGA